MIYLLLILYQIKHFICDYPLQTSYMLKKFSKFPDFVLPLLAHAGVHSLATFLICAPFGLQRASILALIDGTVHFIIDRLKASPSLGGKFEALTKDTYLTSTLEQKKSNRYFWWALGADQMAHHLTHYFIIWSVLK